MAMRTVPESTSLCRYLSVEIQVVVVTMTPVDCERRSQLTRVSKQVRKAGGGQTCHAVMASEPG